MRMWEAIETYLERKQPLIIIAGADYGQGSSRDWAARVSAWPASRSSLPKASRRIAQSDRHGRPAAGIQAGHHPPLTLGLDGSETYDVIGERRPRTLN